MTIDYVALIMLIDNYWAQFVRYCGNERDAEETLAAIKKQAGMDG